MAIFKEDREPAEAKRPKIEKLEMGLKAMKQPQVVSQDSKAEPEERTELSAAQKRMKYLKIGAAAVGGGALLAVTGEPNPAHLASSSSSSK